MDKLITKEETRKSFALAVSIDGQAAAKEEKRGKDIFEKNINGAVCSLWSDLQQHCCYAARWTVPSRIDPGSKVPFSQQGPVLAAEGICSFLAEAGIPSHYIIDTTTPQVTVYVEVNKQEVQRALPEVDVEPEAQFVE